MVDGTRSVRNRKTVLREMKGKMVCHRLGCRGSSFKDGVYHARCLLGNAVGIMKSGGRQRRYEIEAGKGTC